MGRISQQYINEFFSNVWIDTPDKCWPWLGGKTAGYGKAKFLPGLGVRAHRISYRIHKGPIPRERLICHTCDNRACVNPNHLYAGTHLTNNRDAIERGQFVGYPHWKGSAHPVAKLNERKAAIIKRSPLSNLKLANKYGVDQKTIYDIKRGIGWKHVA